MIIRKLCAAAVCFFSLAVGHAYSSEDALLEMLVKKGVLTLSDAAKIQEESHKQDETVVANKIKLSDSVTQVQIYGDGRIRYAVNKGDAAGYDAGDSAQRERFRYRLRIGANVKLKENWSLGMQFGTNNGARSSNVTLGENDFFGKATARQGSVNGLGSVESAQVTGFNPNTGKSVTGTVVTNVNGKPTNVITNVNWGNTLFVDRLFLQYQPFDWVTLTAGKLPNPFVTTRMVWDPDIAPEGFAEQFRYTFGGGVPSVLTTNLSKESKQIAPPAVADGITYDLFANFGQFIYEDIGFENNFNSGTDPFTAVPNHSDRFLLGYQIGAKANFSKTTYFQVAPAFYNYTGGGNASAGPFNGDSPAVILNGQAQPTLITFNQTGTNDLLILEVPVELGWTMCGVPFSVFGDFSHNFDADTRADKAGHPDKGDSFAYQVGVAIGSAKQKGDWQLRAWWQHSETYALDPNIVDTNIFDGRLNMQGINVQATYLLTNFASLALQYSYGSRIDNSLGTPGVGALGTTAGFALQNVSYVYLDLMLKF